MIHRDITGDIWGEIWVERKDDVMIPKLIDEKFDWLDQYRCHRLDGPAMIRYDTDVQEYWINGVQQDEFMSWYLSNVEALPS